MTLEQLAHVTSHAKCRVYGWEDAGNDSHRYVLAKVIETVTQETATVYCEPSLVRSTTRPPDVVIVCPIAGVIVVEVKGVSIDDIDGIDPGGQFVIRYSSGARSRNPFAQVRNAMFDIKNAAERACDGNLKLPFRYFVALPKIDRATWKSRWGEIALLPNELIFGKEIEKLYDASLKAGKQRLDSIGKDHWPAEEFRAVQQGAFGDTSVLFPLPEERKPRQVQEASLGEMFDEAAEAYKTLSDEQQKLSAQYWEKGPRVTRGVAGSGKTIVLANNLARRVQRMLKEGGNLFERKSNPRILVVCFNRTLAPFIERKIEAAFRQRTGGALPEGTVDVFSFNSLMWNKSENGLWRYQKVFEAGGRGNQKRAEQYLQDLEYAKEHDHPLFDRNSYDAVYVDEGQDFLEAEFRLLAALTRRDQEEPSFFVFYDDAQNLYGRKRPNWQAIGLNVVGGRTSVMVECFRNTRQILEPAFNVLYGSFAENKAKVPTKAFGDIPTLLERNALKETDVGWDVLFAKRPGMKPLVHQFESEYAENKHVLERLKWLLQEQDVRPQDILILSMRKERIERLADFVKNSNVFKDLEIHIAFKEKDEMLGQKKRLTFSTVASAKGYDAYCVLLVAVNEFKPDVDGRSSLYVGCTRAIEYLEVTGFRVRD